MEHGFARERTLRVSSEPAKRPAVESHAGDRPQARHIYSGIISDKFFCGATLSLGDLPIPATILKAVARVVSLLALLGATLLPFPAWATPTASTDTYSINLAGGTVRLNVIEAGLVSGGTRPVSIVPGSLRVSLPVDFLNPPTIDLTIEGTACIRVDIIQNGNVEDEPPEDFNVEFRVQSADGTSDEVLSSGLIVFVQGGEGPPAPLSCGDPNNLAPQVPSRSVTVLDNAGPQTYDILSEVMDEYPAGLVLRITQPPTLGSAVVINGSVQYTPVLGETGTTSIGLEVCDPEPRCGTGTLNVVVNSSEQPVANDDVASTGYNQLVDIDVLVNDAEGVAIVSVQSPTSQGGTASIGNNEGFQFVTYTPPQDFNGVDTFTYQITGGSTASVTVTVAEGTPTPQPDTATVQPGESVEIRVLDNDLPDPESLTVVSVTAPENGVATITGADRTVTYTPNEGFGGAEDSFQYTVTDGNPDTPDRSATVTVSVGDQPSSLAPFSRNPTQTAVAAAIDLVCPDLNSRAQEGSLPQESFTLLNRCSALIEQADNEIDGSSPQGGVSDALQQIAAEEMLSQGTSAVQIANLQTSNIASRIASLRGGSTGVSLGGLVFSIEGKQLPEAVVSSVLPDHAKLGGGASGDEADPWSRLGVFLNGRWNFGDKDETELEAGFDFDTYGITGGIDYRFTDNLILGLALGYSDTEVEFSGDNDRIDGDAWNVTAYGTWYSGNLYVDFSIGLGDVDFDATRTLRFADNRGGVDTTATGNTSGDQLSYFVATGYNFASGPWTLGPYVSLDYLTADIDGFEESGGQGWALAYDDQTVKSTIATGGARISYAVSSEWGVLVPHLRADFKKEFEDTARVIRARFALDPGNTVFEFQTDDPDTSFYTWAAGFSFVTKHGFSGFVDYEALAGYANLNSSTLTAGIRFERAFR